MVHKHGKSPATAPEGSYGALPSAVKRALKTGVWLLPLYGVLLVAGTLTRQPDSETDFAGYADYLTTSQFLFGHLVFSIFGGVLGLLGTFALVVILSLRGAKPGLALLGGALSIAGNAASIALFGVAAFAQPAIGRLYQGGYGEIAEDLNRDVYGQALVGLAVVGLLAYVIGAVLIGISVLRASGEDVRLKTAGWIYAIALPVFIVSGLPGLVLQPIAGAVYTVGTVILVRRLI